MKQGARFALAFLIAIISISATGCMNEKTVKVGVESHFQPFTYTEQGEPKGFEVELWQAIAEQAGLKYEFVPVESREISSALKSGEIDLAIAGMTVNKARKDELAFSDPYFQTGLVLLVPFGNETIRSKTDLNGKIAATKLDSTAYTYAGSIKGLKELRGYPEISEAYMELAEGRVDCVIFDERNARHYVDGDGQGKAKIVGELLNKESYAIAANKKNRYIGRVNGAIEMLGKKGDYEALYMKWFGEQPKKLPGH